MANLKINKELDEQLGFYQMIDRQFWTARAASLARIRLLKQQETQAMPASNENVNNEHAHFENGAPNHERSFMEQSFLRN